MREYRESEVGLSLADVDELARTFVPAIRRRRRRYALAWIAGSLVALVGAIAAALRLG